MTDSTTSTTQRRYRISDVARSSEDKATRTPFFTTQKTGGVVWMVRPGQEVTAHEHSTSDDIRICLSGRGTFFPEPCEELEIQAGDVMISRPGQCHGMRNTGTRTSSSSASWRPPRRASTRSSVTATDEPRGRCQGPRVSGTSGIGSGTPRPGNPGILSPRATGPSKPVAMRKAHPVFTGAR